MQNFIAATLNAFKVFCLWFMVVYEHQKKVLVNDHDKINICRFNILTFYS